MRFLRELERVGLCRLSYSEGRTYFELLDVQQTLENTFADLWRAGEIRPGPLYTKVRAAGDATLDEAGAPKFSGAQPAATGETGTPAAASPLIA